MATGCGQHCCQSQVEVVAFVAAATIVVIVVVNRNRITCQLPHTKLKELLCQVRRGNGACPCDSI